MLWFSQVEVIDRSGPATARKLVDVGQWNEFLSGLSADKQARCRQLYARLASARAPLQLGDRTIRLDQPQVMGIVNMTPDSFSDGGSNADIEAAVDAAFSMTSAGAAIIDVGGESTRPGAPMVWEGDEVVRVEPLIKRLAASGTAISIDTRKALVMETAIAAGAGMINDISALLFDDRALDVARATAAPVVLMHAPSQGSDPHKGGEYEDVVTDVFDWLEARVDAVEAAGISRDKILVDPGIGFGKSLADNLAIINSLSIYHGLGCAILFGASRKRMIGALSNEASVEARLGGSIFLAMKAVEQGAHIVRVHDTAETVQAVQVWRGLRDAALTARGVIGPNGPMIAKYVVAYIATGIAFAAIDSIWLRSMYTRLYQPEIGELMMKGGFRMGPAVVFYLLYILGMMIFAVGPALQSGKWQTALLWGALLGFFCYMTYDLTNHATMKVWSTKVTVLDIMWGTFLTGSASVVGYWGTTAIMGRN